MVDSFYPASSPRSEIRLQAPNGHGSTNTVIRRYTTLVYSVGNDILYADSASLGATFTILSSGLYSISVGDFKNAGAIWYIGVSYNSTQLTTAIPSITAANRIAMFSLNASTSGSASCTKVCNVGDILRIHDDGQPDITNQFGFVQITKVGY